MLADVHRKLFKAIENKCFKGRIILLTGSRQVGKSTLLHQICQNHGDYLYLDGDDPAVRSALDTPNFETIKGLLGKYTLVLIDEAQRIKNIGLTLKMIHDRLKNVQVLVSGSSALDLGDQFQESLTGRKWEYQMYPISWEEWNEHTDLLTVKQQLDNRVIYGMYPEVLNNVGEEVQVLKELTKSYLYKDVFALSGIKKPDILEKLVTALAYQIGNEVSYNELSQLLAVDKNTVASYIELLEKAFVVYRLEPYSRNHRNEIKSNRKIYFFDTGVRNAVINNFNPLHLRNDKGALWENFVINERLKYLEYHHMHPKRYFWRGRQSGEVDYIEFQNEQIDAYEIKWKLPAKIKLPAAFAKNYTAEFKGIDTENFSSFVM
jgi:uncharacterized protein